MVISRPLWLLQRPLSVLVHKVCLCSKINRGSPSLCSSLRGLNSTIQLRIDSYQPAPGNSTTLFTLVPMSLYVPGVLQLIISFLSTWGGLKLRIHSPPGSQSTWKSVKTFRKDFRLPSTKLKLKLKEPGWF